MNEFWEQLKSAATAVSGVVGEYFDYDLKKEQLKSSYDKPSQTTTGAGGYAGNGKEPWGDPDALKKMQKNMVTMGAVAIGALVLTMLLTRKG